MKGLQIWVGGFSLMQFLCSQILNYSATQPGRGQSRTSWITIRFNVKTLHWLDWIESKSVYIQVILDVIMSLDKNILIHTTHFDANWQFWVAERLPAPATLSVTSCIDNFNQNDPTIYIFFSSGVDTPWWYVFCPNFFLQIFDLKKIPLFLCLIASSGWLVFWLCPECFIWEHIKCITRTIQKDINIITVITTINIIITIITIITLSLSLFYHHHPKNTVTKLSTLLAIFTSLSKHIYISSGSALSITLTVNWCIFTRNMEQPSSKE